MSRTKLTKFAAIKNFPNVFEYPGEMSGRWQEYYFKNRNPIVLELGCGKGEYTINLAEKYPEKNFIGIDRKGERIWAGAKIALGKNLKNAAFTRINIRHIADYFAQGEVSEIWLTFPDPYPKKSQTKARLTASNFLELYQKILKKTGPIHLKTDNKMLFDFTRVTIAEQKHHLIKQVSDVHHQNHHLPLLEIMTTYEKYYHAQGKPIYYLEFQLKKPTSKKS